jgi:hypothetical protein
MSVEEPTGRSTKGNRLHAGEPFAGLRGTRKLCTKAGRDRLAWPGSSGRSRGR